MSIESLALIHQLQQTPKFEKLTDQSSQSKTEQAQKIAFAKPKPSITNPQLLPSFLRGQREEALKNIVKDNGSFELPAAETPQFSFERESKFEPIGLQSSDSLCSGSIITQIINGKEHKFVVTIGHCLSDEMKLLLKNYIQMLTDPKFNYEGSNLLDPAIAIPLEVFEKLKDKIRIVYLSEFIDPDVRKLMEAFKTYSGCDISKPNIRIYNTNIISRNEDPDHPENAFESGLPAVVSKSGKSGSITIFEGVAKDGSVCLNPKLMSSHGISINNVSVTKNMLSPSYIGDLPPTENLSSSNRPARTIEKRFSGKPLTTKFFKESGFINLSTPFGILAKTEYETENILAPATIPMAERISKFKKPNSMIKGAILEMDGKKYKITKPADKTQSGIITKLEPKEDLPELDIEGFSQN
jgi:hypothetical protein